MLSKTEIRILQLLPAQSTEDDEYPIQCQTQVVPLSASAKYETLSYVWGDQKNTTTIRVDGNKVSITKTLEAALKRLQLRDRSRCLWIDQLCINQRDDKEKANQVPLMGHIYSNTTQCLIWLGEVRSDIMLSDAESAVGIIGFMSEYGKSQDSKPRTPQSLLSERTLHGPMQALKSISLGSNPWWQRIWTLQEAVLPSKSCMLWGPLSVPWDTLVTAGLTYPVPPVDDIIEPYRDVVDGMFAQTTALDMAKNGSHGPLDVIFRWSFRKASNPRDKVYGLLGLFPMGTLHRVEACNYGLSPASVYAMATVDLIEHHQSLHPIALRCLRGLPDNTPDIPGWALDMAASDCLSMGTVDGDDAIWCAMHNYHPFNACGRTTIDWTRFQFDHTRNSLTLTGYKVDTIALACPRPQSDTPGNRDISYSEIIRTIKAWYAIADNFYGSRHGLQGSKGQDHWSDSFWRALLGGLKLDPEYIPEGRATSVDIKMMEDFVRTSKKNASCYSLFATMCHRTMYLTEGGLIGVGPPHLDAGDEVWILHGGKVPFLLRPRANVSANDFFFVGSLYVDGIMDGETTEIGNPVYQVVLQ